MWGSSADEESGAEPCLVADRDAPLPPLGARGQGNDRLGAPRSNKTSESKVTCFRPLCVAFPTRLGARAAGRWGRVRLKTLHVKVHQDLTLVARNTQ